MKKLVLALILATATVTCTVSCKSPSVQKKTVNTLYSLHVSVDKALNAYLDLVIQNTLKTNSVPKVLSAYDQFQGAYNVSLLFVAYNTNAVPPQTVIDSAANVLNTITTAKEQ